MGRWVREADLDGFNTAYVTTPCKFEDVGDLLIPELRRRGLYAEARADAAPLTAREEVYGEGQPGLRSDHFGSTFKYDVFQKTKDESWTAVWRCAAK